MLDQNVTALQPTAERPSLAFKKQDVLDGVVTDISETRPTQFLTWQISRLMRRDFYVMTSCMFRRARSARFNTEIQNFLEDLREEVHVLEHRANNLEMPEIVVHSEAEVQIRSRAARDLYEIMMDYDRVFFKTLKYVAKEDAEAVLLAFTGVYSEFKRLLIPPRQKDSEHGSDGDADEDKKPG